jgi:polysaccharide export outer membrane protein
MVKLLPMLWVMFCWMCSIAAQADATPATLQSYMFGPGDTIKISVYQEDDLSVTAEISQQGFIDMPLLGSVKMTGLTQQSAKEHLEQLLKDGYLVAPSVSITVDSYRPCFFLME